jgi:PBS lyase HEAT-like repeat
MAPRPWLLMRLLPVPRRRKGAFAPLDGLDEIPWADLRHARGSAADVPGILRGLARPGGGSERADLLDRLDPSIWDQGVCSAGAAAAPFLIELACTPAVPSRAAIVGLIGRFAAWPNEMGEPWRSAQDAVRCQDALVAGHDALVGLLQDADGSVRAAAAELMWAYAVWSPRADGALAALLELDAVEPDIAVRVSLRRDGVQAAIDARGSGAASAGPIAAAVERLAGTPRMAPGLRLACLAARRRLDPASVTWRELLDAALAPDTPREGVGWGGGGSHLAVVLCDVCGADSAAWLNLIRCLIGHEQAQVRAGALRAVGEAMARWRSAPAELVPLIGPLLADPEPEVRMMSADLLAAAGQAGAGFGDRLAAVLNDSYRPAAACAAWALARHGDPRAVPALIRALDEEKSVGFGVSMHIGGSGYWFASPSLGEALAAGASRHGPALAPALRRALARCWAQNGTGGGPPVPLDIGVLGRFHVICQALAACGPVALTATAELEALLGSTHPQLALTVIEAAGPAAVAFAPRLERLQRECLEAAVARLIPSAGLDVTDTALKLRPGQSAPWITALAAAGTCFVLTGDGQALLRTVDEVLALTAPIRHHDAAADGGPNLMYTPAAHLAGALACCLSRLGPAAADRMSWPAQWLRANHWRRRSHEAVQVLPGHWVSRAAVQVAGALWRTTGDAGLACRVFEHVLDGPPPSGYDPVELDVLRHVADMGAAARPLAPLLRARLDQDERIFTSGWRGIAQDEEARQFLTRALATG